MYQYTIKAAKVIDGDTIDLIIDLGFHVTITLRIRLKGLNAPEMNTAAGKAAKEFAQDWLNQQLAITGNTLILETFKDKTEKYGRYLGTIRSTAGGNLNADLLAAQHAVPYMVDE